MSFVEKNRRNKKIQKIRNGNGCRSDTNYVYVSQEDFDEKNRKKDQKKTKKIETETEEIPYVFARQLKLVEFV